MTRLALRPPASIVVALAIMLGIAAPATGAEFADPAFEAVPVAQDLVQPVGAAYAPDGRLFVAERDGTVRVVEPDGVLRPDPWLDLRDRVNSHGDRGMLGIAVDSDFAAHPYVYLVYVHEHDAPDPDGPKASRLLRVTVTPDGEAGATKVLIGTEPAYPCVAGTDCLPSDELAHSIGTVRSAPDGTLFVGNGDALLSGPHSFSSSALRPYDADSFAGKILHVDREGDGLPGHPFCPGVDDLDAPCTKVFAAGFRNPFRFAVHPAGNRLIVGDIGDRTWEEINDVEAGDNLGWPCWEGPEPAPVLAQQERCAPWYAEGATLLARYWYVNLTPESRASVLGGPVYPGGDYPDQYDGRIFAGDTVRGVAGALAPGGSGEVPLRLTAPPFVTGLVYPTDLFLGPTGDLHVVEIAAGRVLRIRYAPEDKTPVAIATATPATGSTTVAFDAGASFDPLGDELEFAWDLGDGSTSDAAVLEHTYDEPGRYVVRVTVSDGGLSATKQLVVFPGLEPPTVSILAPGPGSGFRVGDRVQLRGAGSDEHGAPITGTGLAWTVVLVHADHEHRLGIFRGAESAFESLDTHGRDSHYRVTLSATDTRGLSSESAPVELHPRTVAVRLASDPPGAGIAFGEVAEAAAPWSTPEAAGFQTPLQAVERFERDGATWVFERWDHGGERSQLVRVPDADVEYVARYRLESEAAGLPLTDAAAGADAAELRRGPVVRLIHRSARRLAGAAYDPQGVASVRVALRRAAGSRCVFARAGGRVTARRRCDRPRWLRARLGPATQRRAWSLVLARPLPRGRYALLVRARDGAGTRSRRWEGARASLALRVK